MRNKVDLADLAKYKLTKGDSMATTVVMQNRDTNSHTQRAMYIFSLALVHDLSLLKDFHTSDVICCLDSNPTTRMPNLKGDLLPSPELISSLVDAIWISGTRMISSHIWSRHGSIFQIHSWLILCILLSQLLHSRLTDGL